MTRSRHSVHVHALLAGAAAISLGGCSTTAEAQSTATQITQAEARQGAEAHPQLLQEFGGAMSGPQAQYVEQVGQNIAVQSSLSNARNSFTVMEDKCATTELRTIGSICWSFFSSVSVLACNTKSNTK